VTVVVDTSVAVAWYVPESFSTVARQWQDRILEGAVRAMAPTLHYLEFANVLRTLVVRRELSAELAADIYALHLDAPLHIADAPNGVILDTALAYRTTAYDAAFIALALETEAALLTAERTTTPWVVKLDQRAISIV
jgi:predicted nucleic acid-binding protein